VPPEKFQNRDESLCPCKSRRTYADCCGPFHRHAKFPATAEELMRSRYSAYFFRLVDYLVETTHPDTRYPGLRKEFDDMINHPMWKFLTILRTSKGQPADKTGKVEFTAQYFLDGNLQDFHEYSRFKRFKGRWMYLDDKG
jgi:SEC-C motif-containing protein